MRAGLNLVPVSFTGESEGVAVHNIGVSGVPVELILPEERQQAMDRVKAAYPGLVVVDFTLPTAVNGAEHKSAAVLAAPAAVHRSFSSIKELSAATCNGAVQICNCPARQRQ